MLIFPWESRLENKSKHLKIKEKKKVHALKEQTKADEEKSDDMFSMQKKTYNRLLKEKISEI